jgi:hypothetical protein
MEIRHHLPEIGITGHSADIEIAKDNWNLVEGAQGDFHHYTKGAAPSAAKSPEEVSVLMIVCDNQVPL